MISLYLHFEKCLNALTKIFMSKYLFKKTFFNKSFMDSTPSKSPSDSVKHFFHFRKDFINPYGPTHDASSFIDQQIGVRLL